MASTLSSIPIIGSLFDQPSLPPPPKVEEPAVMPEPSDEARRKARRQGLARQQQRQGRASTIFTSGLGG